MPKRSTQADSLAQTDTFALVKKIFLNSVKLAFTIGILLYLYSKGVLDFTRVRQVLTNVPVVVVVFTMLSATTVATVFRWRLLLKGQGIKVPFLEALRLTMIGVFFNTAIPGAVSGDVVKGYYIVRQQPEGRGRIKAFTTLLLDRLLGLSGLVCVSFVAMLFNLKSMMVSPTLKSLCGFISLLWLGVVVFYLFVLIEWSFSKKILNFLKKLPMGDLLGRFFEAVKAYENCKHFVIRGLFLSMAIHIVLISSILILARSLGGFENVPLGTFFFLVPIGMLVTAIPIAPAGLGTGHAAFLFLFRTVGPKNGADLYTAFVSFQILLSLIGGLFYVKYRGTDTDERKT